MFAKTVRKILCRLTLDDTFPDTLSEKVAKTVAIKNNVCEDVDIHAGLVAYTDVDTINEFEPVALVHPKAYTFS